MMNKIGIIGEGSWGTALLKILQLNGHHVNWLVRDKEMRNYIAKNYHNPNYSSDVEINMKQCSIFESVHELIASSQLMFWVLPSAYTEVILKELTIAEVNSKYFFSATKGILPDSNKTVTQYLQNVLHLSEHQLGFISGPSHSEEIARERLTYLTIMSKNDNLARDIAAMLSNRFISTKVNNDVLGAEYATALKNVMAIAVGIAHGLGYGDNFIAVLVSNALSEIERFVRIMSPHVRSIIDYVYLGDLLVTCYSQYSRNRTFGLMLGKGYSIKTAQLEMNMVAEGYFTVKSIVKIAHENNIEMPISLAVYHILYERYSPSVEMRLLTDKLQ